MRVCLDTNILVAAFAARGLCADVLRAVLTEHELVLGDVILEEFRRVMKSKLRVPEDRIESAVAVFSAIEVLPKPEKPHSIPLRDRADRWVLATAVLGAADVLVTGDSDLLDVRNPDLDGTQPLLAQPLAVSADLVTPRAFWELLRQGSSA